MHSYYYYSGKGISCAFTYNCYKFQICVQFCVYPVISLKVVNPWLEVLLGCAKFVDTKGILKPGAVQANQIVFERKSEDMGKFIYAILVYGYID